MDHHKKNGHYKPNEDVVSLPVPERKQPAPPAAGTPEGSITTYTRAAVLGLAVAIGGGAYLLTGRNDTAREETDRINRTAAERERENAELKRRLREEADARQRELEERWRTGPMQPFAGDELDSDRFYFVARFHFGLTREQAQEQRDAKCFGRPGWDPAKETPFQKLLPLPGK